MATPAQVAVDWAELGVATIAKAHGVVVVHGALLQTAAKRNASLPRAGPPGPRLQTGTFVRSINRRTTRRAHSSISEVGSNAPQAMRLEFGFVGTDSLGRTYNQPPYPWLGPALDEVGPKFVAAMTAIGVPKS